MSRLGKLSPMIDQMQFDMLGFLTRYNLLLKSKGSYDYIR